MNQRAARIETGGYVALVMAIGFLTFYALTEGIPFLVRLVMIVATQVSMGEATQPGERRDGR